MNTNQLKKFAQEARRKLLEQVGAKLAFVLTTDSAELREKTEQVKQLREELNRTTKEQLIEKVAYTWFNRLMALRFMDANDYQPLGIRVITPKDGYTTPELLDEAKRGNIPDDLKLKRQRVYDILDNRIPSTNQQNEAYKELLIAACNHLNSIFPFLFEKINDYTELLLPDDLTSDFSIVKDIRDGMPIVDCKNVEIIGWLYQFYISEKKDEVFATKAKVKKEDIPAATQLFTPRWIVEYMVQNTIGKLWLQNHPKSRLREHMPYLTESASLESEDYLIIDSPEKIKFLDPASGSGHILVYAFDLFTKIYEEEGYNISDIPKLIIEKNLYGFEIDDRAAQLSELTLMMKAREYQRRAFQKDLKPNILCFQDLNINSNEIKDTLNSINIKVSDELMHDLLKMQQSTNCGSLIIPHAGFREISDFFEKLLQLTSITDVFQKSKIDKLLISTNQLQRLSDKYHCVAANPPYMGGGNMNMELSEFVKTNYPDSKADLMACFMESGLEMLQSKGFLGMINQHSWMFLSSYSELRKKLIETVLFDTLLHLGARTFPEIGGEVVQNAAFTFWNTSSSEKGIYIRLVDFNNSEIKRIKTLEAIKNPNCGWFYSANQKDFKKILGSPIGYFLNKTSLNVFALSKSLSEKTLIKKGISTSNNERFLRFWFEVEYSQISNSDNLYSRETTWVLANKGGEFQKYYGNQEYVLKWANDGEELKSIKPRSVIRSPQHFFKPILAFSKISSSTFSIRKFESGFISIDASSYMVGYQKEMENFLLGVLNSKIFTHLLGKLTPTLNFEIGDMSKFPVPDLSDIKLSDKIKDCVDNATDITKGYVLSKEQHWLHLMNNLLQNKGQDFEESFDLYKQFWRNRFIQLHEDEEEINRQLIDLYGMQKELTPDVHFKNLTILQGELDKKVLSKVNNKFLRESKDFTVQNYHEISLPFISEEIIAQFISYSVGCMFGRYSLDKERLVLSNQGETIQDYLLKVAKSKNDCSFLPDEDNIIPILDDEWFEDDITGRFYQFLKVTFGETNYSKNLAFIEEQLGKNIRKYFTKDFYPDHIQRYKKRPIYWMFSSPKGSFNVLIYMHRYTPDTVSNILNKYLKEFISKLKTRKEHLQHLQVSGSPAEKTKAIKENDSIDKMVIELQEYERDFLFPLAAERIAINLDDGVLVNYNKFGKAIKEVFGLNDKVSKNKVRKFDWIDSTEIR